MAGRARQRTAAQRRSNDEGAAEDVVIQDEQEQEDEINALKAKHAADTKKAQQTMDIGVIIAILVHSLAIPKYAKVGAILPIILVVIQISLLPLSLTPSWVVSLAPILKSHHEKVVLAQLVVLIVSLHRVFHTPSWRIIDIIVWGLPFIISASVELQRRSERDMEENLRAWDKTRYNVKGA